MAMNQQDIMSQEEMMNNMQSQGMMNSMQNCDMCNNIKNEMNKRGMNTNNLNMMDLTGE